MQNHLLARFDGGFVIIPALNSLIFKSYPFVYGVGNNSSPRNQTLSMTCFYDFNKISLVGIRRRQQMRLMTTTRAGQRTTKWVIVGDDVNICVTNSVLTHIFNDVCQQDVSALPILQDLMVDL